MKASITQDMQIPLTQGKFSEVDDSFAYLADWKWCAESRGRRGQLCYATKKRYTNGKQRSIYIHRVIMEELLGRPLEKHEQVDHIDSDGLNNKCSNLRICTPQQQIFHRRNSSHKSSKYRGVTWSKAARKWQVQFMVDGVITYLGVFDSEEDAAKAYDNATKRLHGAFAMPNFPGD